MLALVVFSSERTLWGLPVHFGEIWHVFAHLST